MAFREVLVTQVREVLRAWLAGAGKRPAARRAGVDVKTAARYIRAAQAAGLARGGDESQLSDELLGQVVVAVRPARPAGHGESWEALAGRQDAIKGWVKDGLTLVKMHELLERSGTVVPYRTLARFAAAGCGYSSSARQQVTVPVADGKPGEEVQLDFGYLEHRDPPSRGCGLGGDHGGDVEHLLQRAGPDHPRLVEQRLHRCFPGRQCRGVRGRRPAAGTGTGRPSPPRRARAGSRTPAGPAGGRRG